MFYNINKLMRGVRFDRRRIKNKQYKQVQFQQH